ncbi:hydrogenase expression/formation protein HypE [Thalassobacillus devorans]|uniref:hydrogenase expression/formation protein HypE n=1 Tax=Thalassobacillus devorans TaxID=279813 RepID=UPI00048FDCC0|nr:hydrogenase expression/formation protein HypE [Thalassobacillus devorans]
MKKILLSHGDGGSQTHQLIREVFQTAFGDAELEQEHDAAVLPFQSGELVVSTDSFVINPVEFPGGDIGKLAVTGTINDLAVSGARPAYMSVGFILEEGLEIKLLKKIVQSFAATAKEAGIRIVTGDTKVVERGKCDQLYINTTGIGYREQGVQLAYHHIQPGDRVIINGGIGEHAAAVLGERMGIPFTAPITSDCQLLHAVIKKIMEEFKTVRFMRDPTRGGIATTLKEIALKTTLNIVLEEERIPVKPEVRGTLELMGLDAAYMANEGKVLLIAGSQEAEALVQFLQDIPGHEMAAEIGEVTEGSGQVLLKTEFGGTRVLDMLSGEPLPRIC